MRVLVATVQVPFARGGAELHAEGLRDALRDAGHEADIVAVPFNSAQPDTIPAQMLACRLLDVTQSFGVPVDVVIGLRFPSYLVRHPNKVLWILHQHRPAYDLWGQEYGDLIYAPSGVQVRNAIRQADRELIPEAKAVFANSRNVARRLKQHCGLDSVPLYHPPRHAELFHGEDAEDYLFFPSRLATLKRQSLIVEALAQTRERVRVRFAGAADYPPYERELKALARRLKVDDRAEWLGSVSEEEKRRQYARCVAVIYPPRDEDFGYVTLEAMLASKPVLTCSDSGGPLEFVRPRRTGLVAEPTAAALAAALDELWRERGQSRAWGKEGRKQYDAAGITWPKVVGRLLACA
jgi:glycosyltransferase involved in cell wall biosynthesis